MTYAATKEKGTRANFLTPDGAVNNLSVWGADINITKGKEYLQPFKCSVGEKGH